MSWGTIEVPFILARFDFRPCGSITNACQARRDGLNIYPDPQGFARTQYGLVYQHLCKCSYHQLDEGLEIIVIYKGALRKRVNKHEAEALAPRAHANPFRTSSQGSAFPQIHEFATPHEPAYLKSQRWFIPFMTP